MSFESAFELTPSIVQMAKQYNCNESIVSTENGAQLAPQTVRALLKIAGVGGDVLYSKTTDALLTELSDEIIRIFDENSLTSPVSINFRPEVDKKSKKAFYALDLHFEDGRQIPINLLHLGVDIEFTVSSLIQEKPHLCWVLDSRSPFFNESRYFATQDIDALQQLLGLMKANRQVEIDIVTAVKMFMSIDLN